MQSAVRLFLTAVSLFHPMISNPFPNIPKYPKDLHSLASRSLLELNETYEQTQEDIEEQANSEEFTDENVFETTATVVEDKE